MMIHMDDANLAGKCSIGETPHGSIINARIIDEIIVGGMNNCTVDTRLHLFNFLLM